MSEQTKPVLQKPPGYRDPRAQAYVPPKPPVRKPVIPPSFHRKKKRRSCCRPCCCYTCVLILILIIIVGVAGSFFYLWYQPRFPIFYVQSLHFPRFNITNGPDGPALNSQAVVRIEARNPNGVLKVNYGKAEVNLNAENMDLGTASLPEFTQGKKNTTVLKFTTQVKNVLLENGVAKQLKGGFRTKRLVVETEVRTGFGYGAGWWEWNRMMLPVKVLCGRLSLKEVERGAVPKCKINMFRWINIL